MHVTTLKVSCPEAKHKAKCLNQNLSTPAATRHSKGFGYGEGRVDQKLDHGQIREALFRGSSLLYASSEKTAEQEYFAKIYQNRCKKATVHDIRQHMSVSSSRTQQCALSSHVLFSVGQTGRTRRSPPPAPPRCCWSRWPCAWPKASLCSWWGRRERERRPRFSTWPESRVSTETPLDPQAFSFLKPELLPRVIHKWNQTSTHCRPFNTLHCVFQGTGYVW